MLGEIHEEIQRAILMAEERGMLFDTQRVVIFFQAAYMLGRAREGDNKRASAIEQRRLSDLLERFFCLLHDAITQGIELAADGRASLNVGPIMPMLDQAYYLGREDGAA